MKFILKNLKLKKYYLVLIILFVLICSLISVSNLLAYTKQKTILTTIYPYYLLVKEIAGSKFEIKFLIPVNLSPHTYSPKISDVKMFELSSLIIANGLNLEHLFIKMFNRYKSKTIFASSFIDKQFIYKNNPHIWLNPIFLKSIAEGIAKKLIELNPSSKTSIIKNLNELLINLTELDIEIKNNLNKFKNRNIITFHDSFRYFALRYNLNIAGIIEKFPGKEPTIKDIINLKKIIKSKKIKILFKEPQLNPHSVLSIAKDLNLKIYTLDPLGGYLKVNSIYQLIYKNYLNILYALKYQNNS